MLRTSLFIGFCIILFTSCEEVRDVELNYSNERLVIEGHLNWIKENNQTEQLIVLSKTTPYFENRRIPANGAQVQIRDQQNNIFQFTGSENGGMYFPLDNISSLQFLSWVILQNTQQGGPFQTNPANLNGNMINLTKPENNPLGYFRVSEVSEINYIVK